MNNQDYPVGSDTSEAPWNQPLDVRHRRFINVTLSYYDTVELPPNASEVEIKEILNNRVTQRDFPKDLTIEEIVIIKE